MDYLIEILLKTCSSRNSRLMYLIRHRQICVGICAVFIRYLDVEVSQHSEPYLFKK